MFKRPDRTYVKRDHRKYQSVCGKLEPGIFQKLPETFEHIYTSFPDGKIEKESLLIGGNSVEQLISEMERANISISDNAQGVLLKKAEFISTQNPEAVTLVCLAPIDLGLRGAPTLKQIFERVEQLGLELCPLDVVPNFRLKNRSQSVLGGRTIGTEPIVGPDGRSGLFSTSYYDGRLLLDHSRRSYESRAGLGTKFVFRQNTTRS